MTPELYQRAGDLFEEVRDLPEAECLAAINSACKGDSELRDHVLWLLNADRIAASGAFLDGGAIGSAARLMASDLPSAGAVIGNFRLVEQIGSGGMGVIFKADDLRLNRTVALKVLPEDSISGEDRGQRFRREVRAASLLNHPNIVSVFEADFEQGWPYMVMELITGKTLRQLIASGRPVDSNTIVDLVAQVASALSAAHDAGVVHRDIKPENIMIRDDGFVKVLDFGLAKLRESAKAHKSGSQLLTRPGSVAGTIAYLSPEQLLGETVGPRSDLFSLGVVAYELASGVRPFDSSSDGGVINAILNHTPPAPSSIRPSIGPDLDALILRLIEKDPELRFQTANDLRSNCKLLLNRKSSSPSLPMAAAVGKRRTAMWGGVALVLVCLACMVWLMLRPGQLSPNDHMQLTRLTDSGGASHPAISPDGKYVAYLSKDADGISIFVMQVATRASIRTVATRRGRIPNLAFSADGAFLYFVEAEAEANGLFRVPLLGGELKRISPLPNGNFAISHDGRFAVFLETNVHEATDSLYILDLSTAESRLLNRRSGSDYFGGSVAWSPDDRDIAAPVCSGNRCGFSFVDSRSGKLKLFGPQSYIGVAGVAWLPDGNHWLALLAGGNSAPQLMLVDYPGGGTRRITNDLDSYLGLSLSLDANLLVTAVHRTSLHIWTAPWSGSALGEPVQFTSGQDGISEAVGGLSWADQDKIIASTPDADGWNLQLIASGGKSQQVTQGPYFNAELTACPDGRTVVFKSDRREQLNLWKIDLPTGRTSQVTSGPSIDSSPTCSPDSKSVIFISARGGQTAIWRVALDGGSAPMRLFPLPTEDYAISRDRKWIATFDTDWWTHPPNLEIVDAGTGSVARKIALHIPGYAAGGAIRWTPDSSGVLLPWSEAGATNLWLQPVQGGRARQITHFSSGLVKDFAFSPDGRRLALSHGADTTDILLLRDFLSK